MWRRSGLWLGKMTSIAMPALSPSMEKGTIVEWKKKVGDDLREGDVLCRVQTDKAIVDFTNTLDSGVIADIFAKEGEVVDVGKTIASLSTDDDAEDGVSAEKRIAPTAERTVERATPVSVVRGAPPSSPKEAFVGSLLDRVRASGPSVVRIAASLDDASISAAVPTGKGGRFVKSDFRHLPSAFDYDTARLRPQAPVSVPRATTEQPRPSGRSPPPQFLRRVQPVYNFAVSDTDVLTRLLHSMRAGKLKPLKPEGK